MVKHPPWPLEHLAPLLGDSDLLPEQVFPWAIRPNKLLNGKKFTIQQPYVESFFFCYKSKNTDTDYSGHELLGGYANRSL